MEFNSRLLRFSSKKKATMNTSVSLKKLQHAADKTLKTGDWGSHAELALKAILKTVAPPTTMQGEGWFSTWYNSVLAPACNKMPQHGSIVKKYQNQTLMPHVRAYFNNKENEGAFSNKERDRERERKKRKFEFFAIFQKIFFFSFPFLENGTQARISALCPTSTRR
jgi:hypothetical protein